MKFFYALLIFLPLLITGCHEDTTPCWVTIPSIELETDEVLEGANSQGISDAWVYMDGTALGVFELPARIPVLAEGTHKFQIFAGIKNNGISATRVKYPFYDDYETELTLTKGSEITINPVVHYKTNLVFELKEDFEDTGIEFDAEAYSDTPMVFIDKTDYPEIVEYGQRCGGIFLTQTDSLFKAITSTYLDLPRNEDVYIEFDYLNNNAISMGVIAQNSVDYNEHTPLVQMNAQDETEWKWKKIYIDLTEDVSYEIYATSYEIYLLAVIHSDLTEAKIYLDNIKVIRYQ